jgi:hypothetical protein
MMKAIALSCLLALAGAKPAAEADAEADAQFAYGYGGHVAGYAAAPVAAIAPVAYHHAAPTCVTEDVILITQVCTPTAEEVCSTETVATQEIEYEKVCTEITDVLCDAPVHAAIGVAGYHGGYVKREAEAEAEAEADAQYFAHAGIAAHHAVAPLAHHAIAPIAHHVAPLPVAHAVAHSVTETVKHACREVTTEHCVDNPKVIEVPVEVEHCHTVTKVTCADVENALPKTTCEAVVTTATQHAVAPVAHHAGYAGYGYGK